MSPKPAKSAEKITIEELLQKTQLTGIHFKKITGELAETSVETDSLSRHLRFSFREEPELLGILVDATVKTSEATFELLVYADYKKPADLEVPKETVKVFIEKVVIFTVWPYLREKVQSLSTYLGIKPVLLPMIHQNQVSLKNKATKETE